MEYLPPSRPMILAPPRTDKASAALARKADLERLAKCHSENEALVPGLAPQGYLELNAVTK